MSQCLVTATIKDPLGNLYANALVIASFVGQNTTPGAGPYFDGGIPSGQFEPIVPTQSTSTGTISVLITRNDTIQPAPSQWRWTVVDQTGKVSFAVLITISGATQDISAALQAASANLPSTVFPNINVTGSLTAKIIENVRNAADYAGADWCAKVTAADADLGASTFGEIWVTQLANTGGACAAAPTLSPGHVLRFTQGGVYSISVGWTQNNYGHWMIVGDELTYINFTGTAGFVADGTAFGNDMQNIVIRNIVFSGNTNVANAATFHNVARSTFENMHGINATTNGLWFRGIIVCTFKHVGSSVNMFNGAIIPIAYTVFPTNFINFDQNQASTSASIGNTGDIFAECGVHAATTGILFNFLVGSELDVTTAEGCATGISISGGSFGNPMLRLGDIEANTVNDLVILGFQNRLTFRSVSNIASAVSVGGNDNFISGQAQNVTINLGAQGNHFQNFVYSTQAAGGTFTDNSSPSSTTKVKVRNGNTLVYDPDILSANVAIYNGLVNITLAMPQTGANFGTGWRQNIGGWGIGNAANSLIHSFQGNPWESWCNNQPANGATVSVPDANCWFSLLNTGSMWIQEKAAPAGGLAGSTVLYADNTSHTLKASYNNGSFFNIPLVGIANTWTAAQSFGSGNLLPSAAGGTDIGSAALPFGNLWLGTAATNNFKFAPAATAAARTISIPDPLGNTSLPLTIANGTKALNTASITTATCDGGVAATATGTLATDTVDWSFNSAPTTANKYGSFLVVYAVPSANTVTFYTCNPSATTSTPTAMTVNFSVRRP